MKKTILVLAILLTASCGQEKIMDAPKPSDRVQLPAIEWRVVDRKGLMHAYQSNGMRLEQGQQLEGFAGITADGRHVVYTLPPRTVDDPATCTLGHEVLHVALGKYHK